jgi:exopolyphosphatase/guanosine-5'-triphosphate,3'-diphosphate pyrophosphatase
MVFRKRRLASLDIGTNSVLLLIVEEEQQGEYKIINEFLAETKLGEGIAETGNLSKQGIARTLQAILEMKSIIDSEAISDLYVVSTSAVRDAKNRNDFLEESYKILDVYPIILSGKEEAKMAFIGATSSLDKKQPVLLIDIGGGSTEFAYGTSENLLHTFSLNMGCVKISEAYNMVSSKTGQFLNASKALISLLETESTALKEWLKKNPSKVLISGGTATTYASFKKEHKIYSRDDIHLLEFFKKDIITDFEKLVKLSVDDRKRIPAIGIQRAEVFPAGLFILKSILEFYNMESFQISADGGQLGVIIHSNLNTNA